MSDNDIRTVTTVPCGEVAGKQISIERYGSGDLYVIEGDQRMTLRQFQDRDAVVLKGLHRLQRECH